MILIALGGNVPEAKGSPLQTLQWAITEMAKFQLNVNSISSFYSTRAVGQPGQSDYINAVVCVQAAMSADNLLNNLKRIERAAGRNLGQLRISGRWGARPLDLDIIDYKGIVSPNFYASQGETSTRAIDGRTQDRLILPHPRAHLRPFVMRPLVDIAPFWHHPAYGSSALSLWKAMWHGFEGEILHKIT